MLKKSEGDDDEILDYEANLKIFTVNRNKSK